MNIYTKWIMELLGIDAETAIKVQDQMIIDFSECTKRQFNKEARAIYEGTNCL
jgi:hypothetical protein